MCHNKSFYDRHLSPRLVHCGCSTGEFSQMRERVIPRAKGIVVEIGLGSGLNLPHYDPRKVDLLIGVEPDATMLELADEPLAKAPFPAELHQATAERLPLKDAMADTVVVTYALCTIADPAKALAEIKRILKPSGKLLFCEHALATGRRARLQCRLDGVWGKLFGACSITRDPIIAITTAGFIIDDVTARPFPFAQMLLGTHYCGEARARMAAASPMRAEQQAWRERTPLPA
jgi:SAM-dependent methyltransferase